ncbi:MAG: IreB family regulatory phosphoprotein [Oscillospiraceae bacterium]|nr:IreB family regulatory phosphoprotein [Oscillospiraceae bacterium]
MADKRKDKFAGDNEKTLTFSLKTDREQEVRNVLSIVCNALSERGYEDPVGQIIGYLIADEPTYITAHNNARNLIRKFDRHEILSIIMKSYLNI